MEVQSEDQECDHDIPEEAREVMDDMQEEWEERVETEIKVDEVKQVSEKERELAQKISKGLAELAGVGDEFEELMELDQERKEQIEQLRESELS